MRYGLLGGTFDPPHFGHLALARAALATGWIDRVLLMPAFDPPHKSRSDMTPAPLRLALAQALAEEDPRLDASPFEIDRGGTSYTIDTIRALLATHPADTFRLIVGADMALQMHTWREADALVPLARPMVAARPGSDLPPDFLTDPAPGLLPENRRILQDGRFPMEPVDISSTTLRAALAAGEDCRALVPAPVLDCIRAHGLYRNPPAPSV